MASEETKIKTKIPNNPDETFGEKVKSVFLCIHRTNVRTVVNLPAKVKSLILRKINDYKNKPKRTEINKVYVLVGYTTKQNIDNRYNDEHFMIALRRCLLIIISILLLFITIEWLTPKIKIDEFKQIFGIEDVDEMTSNDPFGELKESEESELLTLDNENAG